MFFLKRRKGKGTRRTGRQDGSSIHAVIVGWEGKGEDAQRLAAAIAPLVERLTVIYSNEMGVRESGAGDWIGVPQKWYFGRKFAECLRRHDGEAALLQIQADARSDDWADVVARLRDALAGTRDLGIWAPDVHVCPYPSDVAILERKTGSTFHVAQTDGIVWALSRPIVDRLAELDYEENDIGWGIDWAAIGISRALGREVLRDTGAIVGHPPSRGYFEPHAEAQMERFLTQLSPNERAEASWCRQIVTTRKARWVGAARWPLQLQATQSGEIDPGPLREAISTLWIARGRVFVCGAPDLGGMDVAVAAGGVRSPLRPLDADPTAAEVPLAIALEQAEAPTHRLEVNGLGRAQIAGLDTARLTILDAQRALSVPLGPPVTIPPGTGSLQLGAVLAADEAPARLSLTIGGGPGGEIAHIPLYTNIAGGNALGGWQRVNLGRIPGASQPRTARLSLEVEGLDPPPERPPTFYVAQPHIVRPTAQPDLVWPRRFRGAFRGEGLWFVADPGPLPAGTEMALVCGAGRQSILGAKPGITARRDGDALVIAPRRTDPRISVLWLDGRPAYVVDLAETGAGIAIPPCPRGNLVEMRDATGSAILWSSSAPGPDR